MPCGVDIELSPASCRPSQPAQDRVAGKGHSRNAANDPVPLEAKDEFELAGLPQATSAQARAFAGDARHVDRSHAADAPPHVRFALTAKQRAIVFGDALIEFTSTASLSCPTAPGVRPGWHESGAGCQDAV